MLGHCNSGIAKSGSKQDFESLWISKQSSIKRGSCQGSYRKDLPVKEIALNYAIPTLADKAEITWPVISVNRCSQNLVSFKDRFKIESLRGKNKSPLNSPLSSN